MPRPLLLLALPLPTTSPKICSPRLAGIPSPSTELRNAYTHIPAFIIFNSDLDTPVPESLVAET
jgi:hypothetical protein